MNVFRALASGRWGFREEFTSAFVAYLMSPKMDHGLGISFLKQILLDIIEKTTCGKTKDFIDNCLQTRQITFQDDIFDKIDTVSIRLEVSEAGQGDIVINFFNEFYILIENKILPSYFNWNEQLKKEHENLRNYLNTNNKFNMPILALYLVPSEVSQEAYESVIKLREEQSENKQPDFFDVLTWQVVDDDDGNEKYASITSAVHNLIYDSQNGKRSPLPIEIQHILLSFVDFINCRFQGYYSIMPETEKPDEIIIKDILDNINKYDNKYVGTWNPMCLINHAWGNREFLNEKAKVLSFKPNHLYIPIEQFQIIVNWAINPTPEGLNGLELLGNTMDLKSLYRICKYSDLKIFINFVSKGMRKIKDEDFKFLNNWQKLSRLEQKEELLRLSWPQINVQTKATVTRMEGAEFLDFLDKNGITEEDIVKQQF